MSATFRDEWLRAFFIEDARSKRIPPDLQRRFFRKLQLIDDATSDQDLRIPSNNHFEKLRRHLAGWHAIRVNDEGPLVFKWNGSHGAAKDVDPDNHDCR
jgi:proteic killer suppression protein